MIPNVNGFDLGQPVKYFSITNQGWISCIIAAIRIDGWVQLMNGVVYDPQIAVWVPPHKVQALPPFGMLASVLPAPIADKQPPEPALPLLVRNRSRSPTPSAQWLDQLFKVMVKNLSYQASENDMCRDWVLNEDYPAVRIPTDHNGYSRGYAFLTYQSEESLRTVVGWDGDDYMGRKIRVELAGQRRGN